MVELDPAPSGRYAVAPVRATSSGSPETWSACRCVSSTATIAAPWASASAMYSSTRSTCGSTTANALWVLQPSRYDAQAVSSFSSCRKYTGASGVERIGLDKLSSDLLNSNGWLRHAKKDALFEAIALMGKAFASPRRLELLDLLAQAPRTVDELARASEQSTANTSQHLQALHAAGHGHAHARGHQRALRAGRRRGSGALAGAARRLGRPAGRGRARRARLPRRRCRRDRPRRADRPSAQGRRRARRRAPAEEFEAGHIEGARSIPLDELEDRLAELPADREVVAYCRGPFCAYAHEAVRQLQAAGPSARRLEEGWPEWRLAAKARRRRKPHDDQEERRRCEQPTQARGCARTSRRRATA